MTELTEALLEFAHLESQRTRDWIQRAVEVNALGSGDWEELVPAEVRRLWPNLSLDARLLVFIHNFNKVRERDLILP